MKIFLLICTVFVVAGCSSSNEFTPRRVELPETFKAPCDEPAVLLDGGDMGDLLGVAVANKRSLLICSERYEAVKKLAGY